jgi:hypothetical protein
LLATRRWRETDKFNYLAASGQTNSHIGPDRPTDVPLEHNLTSVVQILMSLGESPLPQAANKFVKKITKITFFIIFTSLLNNKRLNHFVVNEPLL